MKSDDIRRPNKNKKILWVPDVQSSAALSKIQHRLWHGVNADGFFTILYGGWSMETCAVYHVPLCTLCFSPIDLVFTLVRDLGLY